MRPTPAIVIPFLAAFVALQVAHPSDFCQPGEQPPRFCTPFSGSLSFNIDNVPVQGRVVLKQWQIANEQREEIPHQGFLIVHLRAGALVTEIGGELKERSEDSYWSVPAGERMVVRTARDSAVLQTVDFITR